MFPIAIAAVVVASTPVPVHVARVVLVVKAGADGGDELHVTAMGEVPRAGYTAARLVPVGEPTLAGWLVVEMSAVPPEVRSAPLAHTIEATLTVPARGIRGVLAVCPDGSTIWKRVADAD